MKTKNKHIEKEFDTVKTFREIKEKISNELVGKTTEQILEYLKINSLKLQKGKQHNIKQLSFRHGYKPPELLQDDVRPEAFGWNLM